MFSDDESELARWTPLACWAAVIAAAMLICLTIIGSGYVPGGDARRHVAKAFTEKNYREIVVMRPVYAMDHSPGWEWLLRRFQRATGCGPAGLAGFALAAGLGFILMAPLPWLRHPEAWLAAILVELLAIPELMTRLTQARPFLLTEGLLICLLLSWRREDPGKPSWPKLAGATLAFALSTWIHGNWYLWALLPGAFFLASRWRDGWRLAGCCAAGVVLGALFTGHPVTFLVEQVRIAQTVQGEHAPRQLLVGEFLPSRGEFESLAALAAIYLWGKSRRIESPPLARQPAFWLILVGWVLGFFADRFWADWGMPAALAWMATELDAVIGTLWEPTAPRRLLACALIALPLCLDATNDLDQRYTRSLREPLFDAAQPELSGWAPAQGGIFYSAKMRFFYDTFYANPQGDWRYILGFEPALMPEDDLKILRTIQLTGEAPQAYEPWVRKMRPEDRLEIDSVAQPDIPELEWKRAAGYLWIGRLPGKR